MARRPENHVTRARQAAFAKPLTAIPAVPGDLLEWLEQTFPPRCKRLAEPAEQHAMYAGYVELIAFMRDVHDNGADFADVTEQSVETEIEGLEDEPGDTIMVEID